MLGTWNVASAIDELNWKFYLFFLTENLNWHHHMLLVTVMLKAQHGGLWQPRLNSEGFTFFFLLGGLSSLFRGKNNHLLMLLVILALIKVFFLHYKSIYNSWVLWYTKKKCHFTVRMPNWTFNSDHSLPKKGDGIFLLLLIWTIIFFGRPTFQMYLCLSTNISVSFSLPS